MLPLIAELQSVDCWSSQLHNLGPSRTIRLPQSTLSMTRLLAERPSTPKETESKNTFFFPRADEDSEMESLLELMEDQENALKTTNDDNSSALKAVGGILAVVGIVTALGYAVMNNFDLR